MSERDKQGRPKKLVPLGAVRIDDPTDEEQMAKMAEALAANAEFAQKVADGFVPIGAISANASDEEKQEFFAKTGKRIANMEHRNDG